MPPPPSFRVGAGKADITFRNPNRVMAGYAYEKQKTNGTTDLALMARAFVIEENVNPDQRRLCLVVIDAWACPEPIKTQVLAALSNRFNRSNLVISATHTHCGPGSYADHLLYNLTTGGHDKDVLKKMVNGIVAAIKTADNNLKPGRVYVAQGDLAGCGDNRSVAAYRQNPGSTYALRTDRQMMVLRFTNLVGMTEKEIGLYSLFAIHPTSLGMFNREISSDNKGWAAKYCEDNKPANYVAAFANANAGDVSPNVKVKSNWSTKFTIPEGGPDKPALLAQNKRDMKVIAKLQADKAKALIQGSMTELTGRIDARSTHVDMSNIRIGGKSTASSAVGWSFAAGSSEDSIARAVFGPITIDSKITEGVTRQAYGLARTATKAVIGNTTTANVEAAEDLVDVGLFTADIFIHGQLNDVNNNPQVRSFVYGNVARALFPGTVDNQNPQNTGTTKWQWSVPHRSSWTADYVTGQGAKPIVFPVGKAKLKKTQGGVSSSTNVPLVPHVIPLQIAQIGGFVLAAVPAEFTTVAGRRLKAKIKAVFGASASHIAMAGYSNDYAFYVTTPEEYDAQHYEGASTIYGPNTLAAYLQEMGKLATALKNGQVVTVGSPKPPPAIYFRT